MSCLMPTMPTDKSADVQFSHAYELIIITIKIKCSIHDVYITIG